MGPVYPRVLQAHGYGSELDVLLAANTDPRNPQLPAAAERLARDVLVFGTYDEVPDLCNAWLEHADALSLVAPFGVSADQLLESLTSVSSRGPVDERV
jgi:hypothetical protein